MKKSRCHVAEENGSDAVDDQLHLSRQKKSNIIFLDHLMSSLKSSKIKTKVLVGIFDVISQFHDVAVCPIGTEDDTITIARRKPRLS
jgi:hypothetical protein